MRSNVYQRGMALAFVVVVAILMAAANRNLDRGGFISDQGRTFERAVVTEVLQDNLYVDGSRVGNQVVALKMRSGPLKGQTVEATSANGHLFGAVCTPGLSVIAISSVSGEDSGVHTVYSLDRTLAIAGFVGLFLVVLCAVGGKGGLKSAVALGFTMVCIFFLYLPMIHRGFSPFVCAVLVCMVTTCATMFLIAGFSTKTAAAVIGTVAGILAAGLFAALFGTAAGITGFNVSNIESLLFVAQGTSIQVGGLLFSGILISALGAVMDVAMSIASSIHEIKANNPALGRGELFRSGMNVGRDMMGTMSNTLILAFTGGALSTLVLNYAYELPALQILNSNSIGIEIMQGVSGSIGIILTVPVVSLVTAVLLTGQKRAVTQLLPEHTAMPAAEEK